MRRPISEHLGEHAADNVFEGFAARLVPWTWHLTASDRYRPLPEVAALALIAAARETGVSLSREAAHDIAAGLVALAPYPNVSEALDALSDRRLAVLSNGTREGVKQLTDHAGLSGHFEHGLAADEVHHYKPAPDVYALATQAFAAAPEEIVLVTAHEWDAAGARAAGLRAALVLRGGSPTGYLDGEPDLVVDQLTDLPQALRRLEAAQAL